MNLPTSVAYLAMAAGLFATHLPAATLTFSLAPPIDSNVYFFDWTHHNGLYDTEPVFAITGLSPDTKSFGYTFKVGEAQTIDRGFATHPGVWDTSVLGLVNSIDVSWVDQVYHANGSTFRMGSLVWNRSTSEFFAAFLNGPTSNLEAVNTRLSPSDYCLLGRAGACAPVSSFGGGTLSTGFIIEANLTTEAGSEGAAVFQSFSATLSSSAVPEPGTWALSMGGLAFVLIFRQRGRLVN